MKKTTILATSALLLAGIGGAASAATDSVTGTVTVNGSVAAKCAITGSPSATLEVNELSQASGTVVPDFNNATSTTVSFTVVCTSPNPGLSLSATPMNYAAGTTETGWTHTVHYTSTLQAQAASGTNPAPLTYTTADALPAASTESVGGPLANASNNITISISNSHTTNATDLLEASPTDGYTGTITFTVSPS